MCVSHAQRPDVCRDSGWGPIVRQVHGVSSDAHNDTIFALSSAPGRSGVAVIRISVYVVLKLHAGMNTHVPGSMRSCAVLFNADFS
jgi:hypothetical protein